MRVGNIIDELDEIADCLAYMDNDTKDDEREYYYNIITRELIDKRNMLLNMEV